MQKEYIEPEVELIKFAIEDIITTSETETDPFPTDDNEGPILPPDPTSSTEPTDPTISTKDPNEGPIL